MNRARSRRRDPSFPALHARGPKHNAGFFSRREANALPKSHLDPTLNRPYYMLIEVRLVIREINQPNTGRLHVNLNVPCLRWYPGIYRCSHLRTLRRRVQVWRREAIRGRLIFASNSDGRISR